MKEENFINRNKYFIILLLFMFLLFFSILYNNRGWEKIKVEGIQENSEVVGDCISWEAYSKEDYNKQYECLLNESTCHKINTKLNTKVIECVCLRNNEPIKKYCDITGIKRFNGGYKPTKQDIEDAKKYALEESEKYKNKLLNKTGLK